VTNLQCIYLLFNGLCGASPVDKSYRPDEATVKAYCKNEIDMKACPRVHQYEAYLEASCEQRSKRDKKE